ncbi:ATP-binding protein [Jannaschia sp. LMIT008]|uniref:ATP-binding protein n=1 Tax=Jannaschia maritima TaxID=3032585 RepID=UPI0028112177|nr:ATP-binding protein [Jannaschia sp. LMIT008]
MDGARLPETSHAERRLRLAAERMLDHVRTEMIAAHRSLSEHLERITQDYLRERDRRRTLSGRAAHVAAERRAAVDRADRADRRLWHAIEAIRDGFALWGPDGTLVQANAPYIDMFDGCVDAEPGLAYGDLLAAAVDEGVIDVGDADAEEWVDAMLDRRADPEADAEAVILRLFDGRSIRLRDTVTQDGDVVSLALDVTADLEREAALTDARQKAEDASAAKSRFLARMSHEFRTPMNGVIGMADLLLDAPLDAESHENARTIRDSGLSLLTIVNDVLDAAQVEAGGIELTVAPFDLEAALMQVVRLAAASKGAARGIALRYPLDGPTRVVGDADRLRQIVTNLVGNGVKFAAGGTVTVAVTLTRPEGASSVNLAIEVSDTGPGIPPDRQAELFGEFARLGATGVEGTGLGLSIARDLARLMGGDVRLLDPSADAPGARFRLSCSLALDGDPGPRASVPRMVRLPDGDTLGRRTLAARLRAAGSSLGRPGDDAAAPLVVPLDLAPDDQMALRDGGAATGAILLGAARDAVPGLIDVAAEVLPDPCAGADLIAALGRRNVPPVPPPEVRVRRVLCADDVSTNRLLLSKMLRDDADVLDVAEDGDDAVAMFATHPADVVLLDISMPRMDGREAARQIRALPGGAAVPLIALTAHADDAEVADIRAAGFDAVLVKPIRKPELLAVIARLMDGAPPRT